MRRSALLGRIAHSDSTSSRTGWTIAIVAAVGMSLVAMAAVVMRYISVKMTPIFQKVSRPFLILALDAP